MDTNTNDLKCTIEHLIGTDGTIKNTSWYIPCKVHEHPKYPKEHLMGTIGKNENMYGTRIL